MPQIRQLSQVYNSDTYDDTVVPGAPAVFEPATSASNLQIDMNNIRSMINEIVSSQGGNWYDALAGRDVNTLDVDLTDLEDKRVLYRISSLADVSVGAGDDYAILTSPGNTPTLVAAIGAVTTLGAVCAELAGAPGSGATTAVAGQNALQPLNLCSLVDTATSLPPTDASGDEIYGLLQIANGATDGAAFDNGGNQAQLSFVVVNATRTGFDLTTDAGGLTIEYAYVGRTTLDLIPENAFIPYAGFVDNAGAVDVTLTNAYANQGVGFAPLVTTITSQTNAVNQSWDVVNAAGANIASFGVGAADGNILAILGDAAAAIDSITRINGTDLDINVTNAATIANGMTFEGTPNIDVGVTDGLIESTGALTLESNSANLTVQTTTGGSIALTSAVAITATTPDAADASANDLTVTLGNSTAGNADGAEFVVNTGDGFGTGNGGNITFNMGDGGASGTPGFVDIASPAGETEATLRLSPAGANGEIVSFYSGSSDPNGVVTATRGSLFLRDNGATGQVWVNTDNGTTWSQLQAGAPTTTLSQAITNEGAGAFTASNSINWGLNDGEFLDLEDSAAATLLRVTSDAGTSASTVLVGSDTDFFDVDAADNNFLNGAAFDTGAAGTTINVGVTANQIDSGGALLITGGDTGLVTLRSADSGTGNAGNVAITGGDGFTGAGDTPGNILITAGDAGAGSTSAGGDITLTTGDADGAAAAGTVTLTGPNDEDEAIATLTTTGTNGESIEMLVGSSDPSGTISALAGSLFFRDTGATGELYLNTSAGSGTTWEQIQTGAGDTSLSEAITNEGAGAFTASNSINWGLNDGEFLDLEDSLAATLLRITSNTGTSTSTVLVGSDTDFFDVDAADNNFLNGAAFDTGAAGTTINVGVTANQIDSGGALTVTGADGGAAVFRSADSTTGSAGNASLIAGNGFTGGGDTPGNILITAGDAGAGSTSAGGDITLTTGDADGAAAAGTITLTGPNDEDEAIATLTTTGTNGESIELLVGSSDPSGSISALAGSLFFRDTGATGELYLNTSAGSGTTWSQVSTGAAETWAATLVAGNVSGGTDPVISSGDNITGVDSAVASGTGFSVLGGSHTGAAAGLFTGGTITVAGGSSNSTTNGSAGGDVNVTGGAYTGTGGGVSRGGNVAIAGGVATAGGGLADGGSVSIDGGDGFEIGGDITMEAGQGQTAGGGAISITGGQGATDGGDVTITGGLTDGGGAGDDGGSVIITAGTGTAAPFNTGDISLTVPTVASGSNIAGGSVTISAGNTGTRNVPGGDVDITAGDCNGGGANRAGDITLTAGDQTGAAGGSGGRIVMTTGDSTNSTAGEVAMTGPNDEDEAIASLTTTGTNGESVELLVGASDPSGSISALAGSLFFRDTGATGELYLNTSAGSGTTWEQVVTGTVAAATWAATLAAGNVSGGTDAVMTGGDTFRGVDGAAPSALVTRGGDGSGAGVNGANASMTGGSATDGNGGSVTLAGADGVGAARDGGSASMTAGNGTTTGAAGAIAITAGNGISANGGTVSITSGDSTTLGDSGDISVTTPAPADGDGGDITLDAGNGVGATRNGGDVIIDAGDSTGAAEGGLITIRSGDSAGGDAGYVHLDMPNDDDEHIMLFTTGGTNGESTQLLVGDRNPDTLVNALGGSLYMRRVAAATGSAVYVNVSAAAGEGTDWAQLLTGDSRTICQGVASGAIGATTDVSDQAPASNVTMDFGTFPTIPSTQAAMNTRTKVYVNGLLQRSGVTVVRTGTQATAVQFNFALVSGDVITVEQYEV